MSRPSRDTVTGALLAVAAFALYLATLAPDLYWHDSAEYAAKAPLLQVLHPPSHPLYLYVAHVFTWLPMQPPRALNLLSAVSASVAIGLAYGLARALGVRRVMAVAAAAMLGASRSFWSNAVIAEVYGLGMTFLLATMWLSLRAARERAGGLATLASLVGGIGVGAHLSVATAGLGLAYWVVRSAPPGARATRIARCALHAGLGIAAVFLLIPLSAPTRLLDPELWSWSLQMAGGANFWGWFDASEPGEAVGRFVGIALRELSLPGLVAACVGVVALVRRDRVAATGLLLAAFGNVAFFLFFRVFDLQVFFLPTVAIGCLFAGVGLDAFVQAVVARAPRARGLANVAALLLPVGLLLWNAPVADRSRAHAPRDYLLQLERELPRDAVLVTFHDPPEWERWSVWLYAQQIEHRRPDVVVRAMPPLAYVRCLLQAGVDVLAFARQPRLRVGGLRLEPEGAMFRVRAASGRAAAAGRVERGRCEALLQRSHAPVAPRQRSG